MTSTSTSIPATALLVCVFLSASCGTGGPAHQDIADPGRAHPSPTNEHVRIHGHMGRPGNQDIAFLGSEHLSSANEHVRIHGYMRRPAGNASDPMSALG
jgi:hypothetical protein